MWVLKLCAVIIGIFGVVSSFETVSVTITPEHAHITPGDDLNIMCKADKPITYCEFKVRHKIPYDLSQGFYTDINNEFIYLGEGLENGDCGMTLKAKALEYVVYVVGCRARSNNSDWASSEMTLINKFKSGMPVKLSPSRQVSVLLGEPITAFADANRPLTLCVFVLTNAFSKTNNKYRFHFDRNNTPSEKNPVGSGMDYFGSGVAEGQCGFHMERATEQHNDGAFVDLITEDLEETVFFRLIVARAPNKVTFVSNITNNPRDGTATLYASCSVRSRPAANLTWFLGDQQIPEEQLEVVPVEEWEWPSDIHVVTQKLALRMDASTNGKELWCQAAHSALKEPIQSTREKLVTAAPPSIPVLVVDSLQLSEGAWLNATCTVYGGQTGVKITWYVGDSVVRRDNKDDDPQPFQGVHRTTQKLRYLLQDEDNGEELKCQVIHETLPQPLQATQLIQFTLCPPLSSKTVAIICKLGGEPVDCAQPHLIGTTAHLACKSGHSISASVVYRKIRCLRNAEWDRPVFQCTPSCGLRNTNSGTVLISGGVDSKLNEFPWQVAIYEMVPSANLLLTCGGTLITPKIIVSAAHCFWSELEHTPKDVSKIKVAVGKYLQKWEESSPHIQRRNVTRLIIPLRYNGRVTQFASDIALLRMSVAVDITVTVNVICVDWDNDLERNHLKVGNNGTVAGWGYTSAGTQSDTLKYVDLPYVDDDTCASVLTRETETVFTHDKFCAGYVNRSISVCRGDSGGGLAFKDPGNRKYYLRGVVSIAFTPSLYSNVCYDQLYTGFTKVSLFIPWILENV